MSNPNFTVLDFDIDGSVQAMHREDLFDMSLLGTQEITRASELLHDKETNTWGIALPNHTGKWIVDYDIQGGFKTYKDCREIEVEWLENSRLMSVDPQSVVGYDILNRIRRERGYDLKENPGRRDYEYKMSRMFPERTRNAISGDTTGRRRSDHVAEMGTGAYSGPFPD